MSEAQLTPDKLIEQLLALPDVTAQQNLLKQHRPLLQNLNFSDILADSLKQQADHFLRIEVKRAEDMADIIRYLSQLTNNPLYEALSLRAEGNIRGIAEGKFQQAIDCYDAASAIYQVHQNPLEAAKTQVGKIGCLTRLGRHDEAFQVGQAARQVLHDHQAWQMLTALLSNLAVTLNRNGQSQKALRLLEEALEICHKSGMDQELPGIEINYAYVLFNLGRLDDSISASQRAYDLFSAQGQTIPAARAKARIATTYLYYGRFNEALDLYDDVLAVYQADERLHYAIVTQLYVSTCLLQLRRYQDVLNRCSQIRPLFDQLETTYDMLRTLINEAAAYAGLQQFDQALATLNEAYALAIAQENKAWISQCNLERIAIFYQQGEYKASHDLAIACGAYFEETGQPLRAAQVHLMAAQAAISHDDSEAAYKLVMAVQSICNNDDIPWLHYQLHDILGQIYKHRQRPNDAITEYEQAIDQMERLRGQVMIEFRADFLTDKSRIYQVLVQLLLNQGRPDKALQVVERAKSRSLVEMLVYQLDLNLEARSIDDQALIDQLQQQRDRRNQLIRGWTSSVEQDNQTQSEVQHTVSDLEREITDLWHRLLIRNADYARDAALTRVRNEPIQPYLDSGTVLLEYFSIDDTLVVFLVTESGIHSYHLPHTLDEIARPARLLNLSFKAVPNSQPDQYARLTANTQVQLQRLYSYLVAPFADALGPYKRLIIVPHGALLHYLPFHALHDGHQYLIERFEVSYLPSASLLHYASTAKKGTDTTVNLAAFGYSHNNRLPHTLKEVDLVASIMRGQAFIEDDATTTQLQTISSVAHILHMATHGDFNPQNPLFSSLTLADGDLCTLDIFNLRLNASLVTLSACQTGRSLVKGGDELLGLMRSFLYAGAASLVLSHWRISDEATLNFMEQFYQNLAQGQAKGVALQNAQRTFVSHINPQFRHPYFWAAFFLVGETGPL